jgi:hypothetical protein
MAFLHQILQTTILHDVSALSTRATGLHDLKILDYIAALICLCFFFLLASSTAVGASICTQHCPQAPSVYILPLVWNVISHKLRGLGPRTNYAYRATAACRRT